MALYEKYDQLPVKQEKYDINYLKNNISKAEQEVFILVVQEIRDKENRFLPESTMEEIKFYLVRKLDNYFAIQKKTYSEQDRELLDEVFSHFNSAEQRNLFEWLYYNRPETTQEVAVSVNPYSEQQIATSEEREASTSTSNPEITPLKLSQRRGQY